ncbi:MAG: ABC transporter substrate-binding protein, partial [Deltaproteobacteria bacterium]|nr:ABC transporter substrate-binding protein [Deltaproteobacteria bacterium]
MNFQRVVGFFCAGAVSALLICAAEGWGAAPVAEPVPIRIGWQIPAATQAQIVQVLKRTDILDSHGLDPSLVPFSYGGPQVDAAFAGKLDVFFSGDQPAINLIARGGKWKIVGRIFYDRIAFIVPPNSPIQSVADLRGKTVASPFGSVAHREAFLEQRAAGLDEGVDVENRNLDILEISRRVMSGGIDDWNGIDAAVVWEPIVSRFELEGLARSLTSKRTLGVVAFSDEFIARHPEAAVQFLVALIRAWGFFAQNPDRVRQWYIDDTQLDYTPEALISGASVDPNFSAKSVHDIDLELTDEQIETLEQGAAWRRGAGKSGPEIRRSVDRSLLARAMQEIASAHFEEVRILLPSTRESPKADTDDGHTFDRVPLWVAFTFMVAIALLAIELGFWLGRRSQKKLVNEPVRPVATVVGAVLGMMAFVIALTFGSANSRFDARKAALLDDVTAIQTAYLRANLLPEPQRTTVRSLLRDYVEARVGIVHAYGNPTTLRLVQRRAEALQESMWSHVEALIESGNDARSHGLFASALNEVFGLHTRRVVLGAHYRIPGFVWCVLIAASCVAMVAVGFQFGAGSYRRVQTANFALSVTFAL